MSGERRSCQVYEGYSLPHAIKRMDLAGRDLTVRRSTHQFTATLDSSSLLIVQDYLIKVLSPPLLQFPH